MKIDNFIKLLNADFFTGVPDSLLKALCNYLIKIYGINPEHHIIAANEGNATAIAAGYYLSTGKNPVVYLQNSGEGNIINPIASLLSEKVYAIPVIFVVGWRGEPGVKDEPQHIYQGEVTLKLLEDMNLKTFVLRKDTLEEEFHSKMDNFRNSLLKGESVAIVVCKDALTYDEEVNYRNENIMLREEIIQHIIKVSDKDPIISTTGKTSREVYETRVALCQSHKYDFLTVGSMGHSSSIALGIAINKPNTKIWCIDGDGAVLMHMGAMAILGVNKPKNLVHIVINNYSHESVGGMPTVANEIDFLGIAKACGYSYFSSVDNFLSLDEELLKVKSKNELCFLEIKSSIGARKNLGRPTTSARENKQEFMKYLEEL